MAKEKRTTDEFDPFLDDAKRIAREFFQKNHRMYTVRETEDGKVIDVFGGFWQWHIDQKHKRVYEISKQQPDEPLKVKLNDDFTLFVRQRTPIRDKLYRWSQEAMEIHLENLDANTHGVVFVRAKNILKVPFVVSAQDMISRQKRVSKAAMTVLNTCWGHNTKLAKVFGVLGKVLWSHLDPEMCRLALMLGGRSINVIDYNLVWENLDEVRKVARTVPGILPVWREIATKKATETGQFSQPDIVKDVQNHLETAFGDGNGLTKRGWKWMIKQKPLWMQHLCKLYSPLAKIKESNSYDNGRENDNYFDNNIRYLPAAVDFLGTVEAQPKFTCFYQMMRGVQNQRRSKELIAMVRAAFKASLKKAAKTFYRDEISLTMDWITREPNPRFDANQLKSDWDWFMRKQNEWHTEVALRDNIYRANTQWESLVEKYEIDGYDVVPLTTAHDLHREGKVMHHCVGTYAGHCEQGSSRIFSIRKEENSIATFELRRKTVPGQKVGNLPPGVNQFDEGAEEKMEFSEFQIPWEVNQCRGACNANVYDLEHIAKHTATLYAKACMELPPKERFFTVMRPNFKTIAPAVSVLPAQPMHDHDPIIAADEAVENDNLVEAILEGRDLEAPEDQAEVQEMAENPMIMEMPDELRQEIAQLEADAVHINNAIIPFDVVGDGPHAAL